jgi:pimeloyl-ACP methyl ester carboxylesterase
MKPAAVALWLAAAATATNAAPAKVVHFKSDDGWTLAASFSASKKGKPTAILVHGVAAGRGEYDAFASSLQARGWGTLALDLRGHGDSTQAREGRRDFTDFDATGEWGKAVFDILAAAQFLEKQGVKEGQVVLIGASIGANLCARVFTALPHARLLVMLSPGADYRGVTLPRVDGKRSVAAASRSDAYAYATVEAMKKELPGLTVLTASGGHGAQMFRDSDFTRALLRRLDRR